MTGCCILACNIEKSLCTGGTRFIGVYLARQLIEQGHSVTLLTRGKKDITFQIPDDTDESYASYKSAVKHIAADRKDKDALAGKLSGKGFDGEGPQSLHARSLHVTLRLEMCSVVIFCCTI